MTNNYDLVIVGGGIAGLRVGIESLKRGHSGLRVIILEKYDYIGGRIVTHYKGGYQWEIGAGRIHKKHIKVRELIKKYGLHWYDNGATEIEWRKSGVDNEIVNKDIFKIMYKMWVEPLRILGTSTLANSTIRELLNKTIGDKKTDLFLLQYPYRAEVDTLRADLALDVFDKELSGWSEFGGCVEGLGAIIREMRSEFERLGGKIMMNCEVLDVIEKTTYSTDRSELAASSRANSNSNSKVVVITVEGQEIFANAVVLALHRDAVAKLPSWKHLLILTKLTMCPLLRIYAVFPKNKDGEMWFYNINKTITDASVRFIIPINVKKGIIMISYTESQDALKWMRLKSTKGIDIVKKSLMQEIRHLFPQYDIPDPIQFKLYPWTSGCTYWLPGNYDITEFSRESHIVGKNVFMCGESWSLRQAWIEGALEHADGLLGRKEFLEKIR
jgi:monoamine oxidase